MRHVVDVPLARGLRHRTDQSQLAADDDVVAKLHLNAQADRRELRIADQSGMGRHINGEVVDGAIVRPDTHSAIFD